MKYLTHHIGAGIILANQSCDALLLTVRAINQTGKKKKPVLGPLPVYICTVRNALWVFLFFSGRCLNWQRESISHARLIRLDFAPIEILLCFRAERAHLSLNFADCRPAERRRPPLYLQIFQQESQQEPERENDGTEQTARC